MYMLCTKDGVHGCAVRAQINYLDYLTLACEPLLHLLPPTAARAHRAEAGRHATCRQAELARNRLFSYL